MLLAPILEKITVVLCIFVCHQPICVDLGLPTDSLWVVDGPLSPLPLSIYSGGSLASHRDLLVGGLHDC